MNDVERGPQHDRDVDAAIDGILASLQRGEPDAAMTGCRTVLTMERDYPPAIFLMGLIAHHSNDIGLAISLVERAHGLDPECRDYALFLAYLEASAGRLANSLYYSKLATALTPHPRHARLIPANLPIGAEVFNHASISNHRLVATIALITGNFEDAVREAEAELHLDARDVESMVLAARGLMALNRVDPALAHLRAAVHVQPASAPIQRWLGDALLASGRHDEALAAIRRALALDPEDDGLAAHGLAALCWQSDGNHLLGRPLGAALRDRLETRRRPRRIDGRRAPYLGIMWDECHDGPLLDFLLPVLGASSETIFYRLNARSDAGTEAIRTSVMRFVDEVGVDPATFDRILTGDRPGALINLCGGGGDDSRFPLVTGDAAPARLQWLSWPMADRLPAIDFVIGSPETADIDEAWFGADKVVTLPTLLAWRFPAIGIEAETVGPAPRERLGRVTFGAVADLRRVTAETVALWAGVLLAVDELQLLLSSLGDWQRGATRQLLEMFANFGLSHRVHLQAPPTVRHRVNLDFFASIDVLLDTAPVNGMTEVAEALWMGVPVVSLKGRRRAGRTGAAILGAAGRSHWVADDESAFAAIAAAIGTGADLGSVRAGLRDATAASPLCDAATFATVLRAAADRLAAGSGG